MAALFQVQLYFQPEVCSFRVCFFCNNHFSIFLLSFLIQVVADYSFALYKSSRRLIAHAMLLERIPKQGRSSFLVCLNFHNFINFKHGVDYKQ